MRDYVTIVRIRRLVAMAMLTAGLAGASLSLDAAASAQTAAAQAAPRKGLQVYRTFSDRFTFEIPAKDWEPIPGGASSLVTLTQKKREATVVVEYQPLHLELEASEIDDNFAKLEAEPISARQSDVNGVGMRLMDVGSQRVVVVDFSRKGVNGPERVRQYSLPVGKHLYRLVCSAPTAQFAKYEPVFVAMVETFKVAGGAASSASAGRP
jgi:hypothetical protein